MYLSEAMRLRLKNLIEENKTNANKLSLLSGMNRSNIRRFLKGENKTIKIESITLICNALGITLKDFFSDEVFNDVDVED